MLDQQTAELLQKLTTETLEAETEAYAINVDDARAGLRAVFSQYAGVESAGCTTTNVKISTYANDINARLYRPDTHDKDPLPLIVFFHGGGWSLGGLESYDALVRALCVGSGALFLSVDYRLAPEHRFPAGLDDCLAAVKWVAENADNIGADKTRIAVMGDSAGGNLAAVVAHKALSAVSVGLAAQFLIYPILDISKPHSNYHSREQYGGGAYYLTCAGIDATVDWYLNGAPLREHPDVSPMLAEGFKGLPTTVVVTAGHDPLRDEGREYAERIKAAGVPVVSKCFESAFHAFLSFGVLDVSQHARAFLADEIRRLMFSSRRLTLQSKLGGSHDERACTE